MKIVFVDTSAFYAILYEADGNHVRAGDTWLRLVREELVLLTTNYVLIETCALLQRRLGIAALRAFHENIAPLLQVDWIDAEGYQSGVEAALTAARKSLSVVACISFQTMRREGVQTVFCFDSHFAEQGFEVLP